MASTTEERNKQLIREAFEQGPFREGGLTPGAGVLPAGSASADLYAATCVFHGAAELFRGTEPSRDYVQAFPDLRLTIHDMIAEGDRVVTHLAGQGTHTEEFRGVAPTGKAIGIRMIVISRFEAARIVEEWGTLAWD